MTISLKLNAALISSAAFLFSPLLLAQAPIIDASVDNKPSSSAPAVAEQPQPLSAGGQGELYNQLIMLQQEVMQLRGIVEEQTHQLRKLKEQSMERYIDLDRRLGSLSTRPAAAPSSKSSPVAKPRVKRPSVKVVASAGEKSAYDAAYNMVINKRFNDALEAFKQFLLDFPGGKYAPNSYYWMGELYQVVTPQNLDASREAFSQLLGQYPDHAKAPDAMYKLGKVYYLKGNNEKSKKWLQKVIAEHGSNPASSAADKARAFMNANF